jgi:hypothetical protein
MITKEDIITPDKFLSLANNYISRYGRDIQLTPERNIFFIKPDFIDDFRANVLPRINYKFKLITHDSDYPVTNNHIDILNNPYLEMWYGMNCHIIHDKLQPVPIGMANEVWPHGDKDTVINVAKKSNEKKNLVYCNFDISTNYSERASALMTIRDLKYIDFEQNNLSFNDYIEKLSTYKYVISPPGNSVDCHRIWESIYVGTIPICLKSIPLVFFKDLPIMFINTWADLTEETLNDSYNKVKSRSTEKSSYNFYKNIIL